MIEIKKGVPIPISSAYNSKLRPYYNAILKMEVGDSFDLNPKDIDTKAEHIRSNFTGYAIRNGMKVATRTDVKGILTVWRIK